MSMAGAELTVGAGREARGRGERGWVAGMRGGRSGGFEGASLVKRGVSDVTSWQAQNGGLLSFVSVLEFLSFPKYKYKCREVVAHTAQYTVRYRHYTYTHSESIIRKRHLAEIQHNTTENNESSE